MRAAPRVPIALSKLQNRHVEAIQPIGYSDLASVRSRLRPQISKVLSLISNRGHEPLNTGIRRFPTRSARPQEGYYAWNGCRASGCKTLAMRSKHEQRARSGCVCAVWQ